MSFSYLQLTYYFHTSFENSNLSGPQMCDFFYTAQEEQNTVRILNVAFSRDERGSSCPDDETSHAVIKILWFHM